MYVYKIFFVHSSYGNLGSFHILVTVNWAAINIGVHVFFFRLWISPDNVQWFTIIGQLPICMGKAEGNAMYIYDRYYFCISFWILEMCPIIAIFSY